VPGFVVFESGVLDLGDGLGLNPSLTGMHQLWQHKKPAIVRGVGYPNTNHSHFVSMDIWQTASPTDPRTSGRHRRSVLCCGRVPTGAPGADGIEEDS
jgi:hypothetical protein